MGKKETNKLKKHDYIIWVIRILLIISILANLAFIIFQLFNEDPVTKKDKGEQTKNEINLAGKRQKNTFQKH